MARHPLDPLSADEFRQVASTLRRVRGLDARVRYIQMRLNEPTKAELSRCEREGEAPSREAFVILLDPAAGATYEAVVGVDPPEVSSWRHVPGVQPPITGDEYLECATAVRKNPDFRAALAKRGITDPDRVMIEPWTIGNLSDEADRGRRLAWTPCWLRDDPHDNAYSRPIEGVYAIVDLNERRVLRVEDHGVTPVPQPSGDYRAERVSSLRSDVRPLAVTQPEGPSFEIEGWEVRWQKWRFRIGFTPREGLVLHTLSYFDQGRHRPIIHRASYAALVIPYGDTSPGGYRKNAFDIGEYGIGPSVNSLELGCDCLGEIRYFDVDLCDNRGEPYTVRNAICLHEEDFGLLWKHYDALTQTTEVRRSRRLVVSFIVTVDNYDYAFYWYLYQDGTIETEAKLTGLVLTAARNPGEDPAFATRVSSQLVATNHQHFFNVRLDMTVDGECNSVHEVHTEAAPPGPDNPHSNAFRAVATPLRRELEAQQLIDPLSARYWRVVNPDVLNAQGEPVAYRLVPGSNVLPFASPEADVMKRAGFMSKHLWVTPWDAAESYPEGDYPNQHPTGDGLPVWTRANRPIENTNLVIWYSFGNHHIPRLEDWPVMTAERVGFALRPDGFFDQNASLDVPPPHHEGTRGIRFG
jgi:primary-amine oxidase